MVESRFLRFGAATTTLPVSHHISRVPVDRMPSDPNNPEVLTSVRTDVEAAAIVGALTARSIVASTTGGYTAGFRAEAPGYVNVIVKYEDLDRARHALADIEQDQPDVDWSQVDVGEPDE